MLDPVAVYQLLRGMGVAFFTGVPDSLLKNFCAFLSDQVSDEEHVTAANEGGAVGLAAGHYLSTGRPALVYLQNSGQGNAVNPLLSICDPEIYGIPMVLLVGWRGEPGRPDEPQHVKQGRVMNAVFDAMEIPHEVLDTDPGKVEDQLRRMLDIAISRKQPVALTVRKGTFSQYEGAVSKGAKELMRREAAIEAVLESLPPTSAVVSTTGHISRELFSCRKRRGNGLYGDFMMVGGMGHASQVAMGIAKAQPGRPVFCFDGDGAALMHMGGMALVGQSGCANLKHIVFNNGAHGSVGGQPTLGFSVDFCEIARGCGYHDVGSAHSLKLLGDLTRYLIAADGPAFLEVKVSTQARSDLERPDRSPSENVRSVMEFLRAT